MSLHLLSRMYGMYDVNNSIGKSFWEVNRCLAGQKILLILQNPSDYYSLHNSLHWCQVFSKRNVVHNLRYNSLSSYLILSLIYTLDSMWPLQKSPAKTPYIFGTHACSMFCPSNITWFYYLIMFDDYHRHNLGGRSKGQMPLQYFFCQYLRIVSQEWCIWGVSGERGLSILRTSSNQSSLSF